MDLHWLIELATFFVAYCSSDSPSSDADAAGAGLGGAVPVAVTEIEGQQKEASGEEFRRWSALQYKNINKIPPKYVSIA